MTPMRSFTEMNIGMCWIMLQRPWAYNSERNRMTQPARRKPLSDKEERVLAYAQLMGVEVASMSRIANRMRAQALEQENARTVSRVVEDYTWTVVSSEHPRQVYEISSKSTGWRWHCQGTGVGSSTWFSSSWQFEVTWTAPDGTVGKFETSPSRPRDLQLRLLPERDRALYGMIRWINNQDWDHQLRWHKKQQQTEKKKHKP